MFIDEKGKELMEKHLYRNFLLHCCNMHEYNVLSPGQVFTAFTQLQRFIRDNSLQHHLTYWADHQKRAFEQKGQAVSLDTTTLELPLAEVSPNTLLRSDFSGIFKKESKSNINTQVNKAQQFLNRSCSSLIISDQKQSEDEELTKNESGSNTKSTPKSLSSKNSGESNGSQLKVNGFSNAIENTNDASSKDNAATEKTAKNDSAHTNGVSKSKTLDLISKDSTTSSSGTASLTKTIGSSAT